MKFCYPKWVAHLGFWLRADLPWRFWMCVPHAAKRVVPNVRGLYAPDPVPYCRRCGRDVA